MRLLEPHVLLDFVLVDFPSAFASHAFRGQNAGPTPGLKAEHQRVSRTATEGTGMAVEFPPGPADSTGLFVDSFRLPSEPCEHVTLLVEMFGRHRRSLFLLSFLPH